MIRTDKNWLEWTVFGISAVLLTAVLGILGYETARSSPTQPPEIELLLGQAERRGDYFMIPLTAVNHGDETAEAVQIEVVLRKKNGEEERAALEIQFLPQGGTRKAVAVFNSDPEAAEAIVARPTGFERPR